MSGFSGSGFGEEVKAERERRGVSLEALCAETKVNARHFQALEEGNYLALPSGVFRRGIVRAYLKALGLDEHVWLSRFQASVEEHARQTGTPLEPDELAWANFAQNVKKNRVSLRRRTGLRWAGVLLLLFVLAVAGWAVWRFVVRPRLGR